MAQVPDTSVTYIGDGSNTNFAIPFDYLDGADVFVSVNFVDTPFTFSTPGTAFVSPAPAAGASVLVYRNTPAMTVKNIFSDGVPFLTRFADMNWKYLLYAIQEAQSSLRDAVTDLLTLNNQTVRASDGALNVLPNIVGRALRYLRFDASGQPEVYTSTQLAEDIVPDLEGRLNFSLTDSGMLSKKALSLVANPTGSAVAPFDEVTLGAGLQFITGQLATVMKTVNGELITGTGNIVVAPTVEAPFANRLALAAASNLAVGQIVATAGCDTAGDNGGGRFFITPASGVVDGYSRILLANGLHAVLLIDLNTYPEHFGAKNDGVTDDGDALRRFIARLNYLRLKAGIGYAYNGTLNITQSQTAILGDGSALTVLIPLTNFGEFVKVARASGPLRGFVIQGVTIRPAMASCTQDSLVMDGVRNFAVNDVVIDKGCRGLVIKGCSQGNFSNMTIIFENDNGGAITARRYIYIEETANANIGSKHPGDIFFTNINGRCGGTPYCYTGLEIHSADGIWFSNYHFGNCTNANVHINADRVARCTGIKFTNGWHDIGTGSGTIIEGSTPTTIGEYQFESVRSLGGNGGFKGYYIDGSAVNIRIGGVQSKISGYLRNGIELQTTFTGSLFVNDTTILDCSLAGLGTYDAIVDRSTTGSLAVHGGRIAGTNHRWSINCQVGKADLDLFNVKVATGTSGAIAYIATAGNRIENCIGFNPRGAITPSVGASPWTYTNTLGFPVTMYVSGGTVSAISVDGVVTGLTAGSFHINNGASITVTYSVVPTVLIRGH